MGTGNARTFSEPGGNAFGSFVSIFGIGFLITGVVLVLSPLRWSGTSIAWSILGVPLIGLGVGILRKARRMARTALIAGPDGVVIVGPIARHEFSWGQIERFRPGTVASLSAIRGPVPVVVAELVDGRSIPVEALRVDHGRFRADQDRARVESICRQIEALRPSVPAPATGRSAGERL